jgi:predicted nucleotidyltransferase
MNLKVILDEFKSEVKKLYGSRLKDIILYGSYARGDASSASDIDVMVVLSDEVVPGREIDRMIDLITDLNLKYDTLLAVVPVSEKEFSSRNSPLLLNVRREGIPA